jgi:hypothetical protein
LNLPFASSVHGPRDGERRRLGATPSAERSRHVFRHGGSLTRIDPARVYPLTCCMMFVHRSMIGSTLSAFSGGNIGTTRADVRRSPRRSAVP